MGHKYVKDDEVFSISQNGVVPKPTQQDISDEKVLKADGTWGEGGGGSGEVVDVKVNGDSVLDENNEAQITSYKEVTQSEYNALPESKLTDGVLYCIKDAPGSSDGFPPLIYSDEEREIGVWTDGKPLYQKVFYLNMAEIASDTFYGISNTNKNDYDKYVYACLIDEFNQGWCASLGYSENKLAVFVHSNRTRSYNYAIVQYTKSADTAGSGTWNQQGALSHHYSTSEKVIGTWIDGKPLYEKTWDLGSDTAISYNSWTEVNATYPANQELMIHVDACTSSGTYASGISIGRKSNGKFEMQSGRNGNNQNIRFFTIQYTKTTD